VFRGQCPSTPPGGDESRMATTQTVKRTTEISDALLRQLKEHVASREVSKGIALLDAHEELFNTLDPTQKRAAPFVGYVAQWVDIGYGEPELLEKLLSRFPAEARARLPLRDYLHLRMAEGLLALLHDKVDDALRHFDLVLSMQEEISDKELAAIAQFWNARCHRKKGEYDEALKHASMGRDTALGLGFEKMAAVMSVLESWLYFQKGHPREAAHILDQAEHVLRQTDDDITLGNIYSAYGRMIRRRGNYNEALKLFSRAIDHFQKRNSQHRNLARSLVNIAYVQRLIGLQISRQIDADRAKRRKSGRSFPDPDRTQRNWERYEQIRAEAFKNLDEAERIYRHHNHHHGIGSVYENRGLLYLDSGDLDTAAAQAEAAYELGQEETDYILIARTRLLQCTIENAKLEEGIEGGAGSWEHAQAARDYAREAVEAARHTQNRRLLARTHIAKGLTACHPSFNDLEEAKSCCDTAASYLRTVDYDDLGEQLQLLKQKLARPGSIDPALRAWTQGVTGGRTFQQLAEQFAEFLIPRVWEQEGKKVQRVAKRLSVSPKKVRRILTRLGKLKKGSH
jgi:tetratricopeptide (TPR) repeat protein